MKFLANPKEIEAKSFNIVEGYVKKLELPALEKEVVKRAIHATGDLFYGKSLLFHPRAIEEGIKAIKKGKNIIVDVNMVKAGIKERVLSAYGGRVLCLINEEKIAEESSRLNITRTMLAMRKAAELMEEGIVAIGNAPTALFELCDLVEKGKAKPSLVVGLPVGFVGAKESKQRLLTLKVPYITNRSRKGGSSTAVAIINALLKLTREES